MMTASDIRRQYKMDTGEYSDGAVGAGGSFDKPGPGTQEYIDWLEQNLLEEWK